uniref:PIN domain-containing protein n=1 Tax=Candidatus Kentrum sp. TC TaxID=2126339 RepID=A0A450ZFI7_9GAMM|nr:MAG: hypothetical protein BECKTC1821E_GA0114239_11561 [Candidatus Kentron sp. TC]VFK52529.1 MAG: hypothetical protein BECKTC1821D_GA0114238_11873 [Candidatus Kentron sp. TC]
MFILDTNVVSALRRPEKADPNLLAWASNTSIASFFLSSITVLELELGTLRMERKDRKQGAALRAWLDRQVIPHFEGRIIAIDAAVARCCAGLHAPDRCGERDALIAASALVHRMTVATRNVPDFAPTGVQTLNPWENP